MNQLIIDFLDAYAEKMEWKERGWEEVSRVLCERYVYSSDFGHGREFLMIAYGWMWGKCTGDMPFIEANCLCGLLKLRLDEVYEQVAKENNWYGERE